MTRRAALLAGAELLAWWAALLVLWLILVTAVDALELAVGTGVAALGALAATAVRRAVRAS